MALNKKGGLVLKTTLKKPGIRGQGLECRGKIQNPKF